MQLNIAVCDDEPLQVEIITSYLKSLDIKYKIEIIKALSGEELLKKIEAKKIDVAFLDIAMENMKGIELGMEIRKKYQDCIIVFITGFENYALDAFNIKALNYILKPVTKSEFNKCMEDIILRIEEKRAFKEKNSVLSIYNKKGVVKIKYEDIYYFEKILNKIKVYTIKGEYEYYGTLKGLKKELDMNNSFIQCHQGYIVNKAKIVELRDGQIYIKDINRFIPVSRRMKIKVKKILKENLF
ncbi:LytR/AlgR family response regulator transcription factor [Caloranaerobacter sp. DY30410]|uniref:LytR/AlgR family response regulator transcription factor n=1 Tax=Caloranaerobacter sp. DY30410 TaxID=3238305 RepID=UPI003D0050ED